MANKAQIQNTLIKLAKIASDLEGGQKLTRNTKDEGLALVSEVNLFINDQANANETEIIAAAKQTIERVTRLLTTVQLETVDQPLDRLFSKQNKTMRLIYNLIDQVDSCNVQAQRNELKTRLLA